MEDNQIEELGWCAELVKCDLCAYIWTAVYPEECEKLDCPKCENTVHFDIITPSEHNENI